MIVVTQHWNVGTQARHILKEHVVVLTGVQRHGHTDARGKISRPHASAKNDVGRIDAPSGRQYAGDTLPVMKNRGDLDVLEYLGAVTACAFGKCLRNIDRIGIAVARDVDAADDI